MTNLNTEVLKALGLDHLKNLASLNLQITAKKPPMVTAELVVLKAGEVQHSTLRWKAVEDHVTEAVQPVQEPVAWVLFRRDEDGLEPVMFYGGERPTGAFKDRFELRGIYLSEPVQPALTDEQITEAAKSLGIGSYQTHAAAFKAGVQFAENRFEMVKPNPQCTCLGSQLGPHYCEVHAA